MRAFGITCIIAYSILFAACGKTDKQPKKEDTPVSGSIEVCVDESFLPVVKAEIDAFQNLYSNAQIHADYRSQNEAVAALLNGKVEMIFIGRPLNKEEMDFLAKKK